MQDIKGNKKSAVEALPPEILVQIFSHLNKHQKIFTASACTRFYNSINPNSLTNIVIENNKEAEGFINLNVTTHLLIINKYKKIRSHYTSRLN